VGTASRLVDLCDTSGKQWHQTLKKEVNHQKELTLSGCSTLKGKNKFNQEWNDEFGRIGKEATNNPRQTTPNNHHQKELTLSGCSALKGKKRKNKYNQVWNGEFGRISNITNNNRQQQLQTTINRSSTYGVRQQARAKNKYGGNDSPIVDTSTDAVGVVKMVEWTKLLPGGLKQKKVK
jgi:hypothetical protein